MSVIYIPKLEHRIFICHIHIVDVTDDMHDLKRKLGQRRANIPAHGQDLDRRLAMSSIDSGSAAATTNFDGSRTWRGRVGVAGHENGFRSMGG